jgi:hypothetical protein
MPIDFVPLLFIMHIVSIAQARNWSGTPVEVSPTLQDLAIRRVSAQ